MGKGERFELKTQKASNVQGEGEAAGFCACGGRSACTDMHDPGVHIASILAFAYTLALFSFLFLFHFTYAFHFPLCSFLRFTHSRVTCRLF